MIVLYEVWEIRKEEVEKVMPYGSEDFWDWLWKILRGKN